MGEIRASSETRGINSDTSGRLAVDVLLWNILPGSLEVSPLQVPVLGLSTILGNHMEKEGMRLDSKSRQVYFREAEISP